MFRKIKVKTTKKNYQLAKTERKMERASFEKYVQH